MAKAASGPASKGSGKGQPMMMASGEAQQMMTGVRRKDMKMPKKMTMHDPAEMMRDPRAGE